ncbi:succinate dehydrogenase [Alphaproteobacteria bacterium LSUCC0684]
MIESRLYALQRLSAVIMAPLVGVHLLTILYAVRGGLSAEEILARTEGVTIWTVFYGLFVVAVAIHAPLGLRKILVEWGRLPRRWAGRLAAVLFAGLLIAGGRAVLAVSGVLT